MKPENSIEEYLQAEVKAWDGKPPTNTVALADLRRSAKSLSTVERHAIEQEVEKIMPVEENQKKKHRRPWRRYAAGLAAACLLFALTPSIVRSAVDLPGLGVYIQQFALRHVGLEWAFENGYMQGTVAQVSKNGVTLKILGVVADPVETTVIYLLQGIGEATTTEPGATVHIRSVDGEGVVSWTNSAQASTSVGLVGTTHTRSLPNPTGIINVEVRLPQGEKMNVAFSASREEISKLAQVVELNYTQTIDDITVTASAVVLTPSQLMIMYTLVDGHNVMGAPPQEYRTHLLADGEYYTSQAGSGGYFDSDTNTWHLQSIFVRPRSLEDVKLVIPMLAKTLEADFRWGLTSDKATATSNGRTLDIFDVRKSPGSVAFRYYPEVDAWAPRVFTVICDDGSTTTIKSPRESWSGASPHWFGVELEVEGNSLPIAIEATAIEVLVPGPWVIPIY